MSGAARMALVLIGEPQGAAQAALPHLQRLGEAGYELPARAGDATALLQTLRREPPEALKLIDYTGFLGALPPSAQAAMRTRWGPPERDPAYVPGELDCGSFLFAILRVGPLAIGLEPRRGLATEPPPHAFLAFHAWLRDIFRADQVIPIAAEGRTSRDEWRDLAMGASAETPRWRPPLDATRGMR